MGRGDVLLVASWGLPFNWGEAVYLIGEGFSVRGRTSLAALAEYYGEERVSGILILVPDTIAPYTFSQCGDKSEREEFSPGSYAEIEEIVSGDLERWISSCSGMKDWMIEKSMLKVSMNPGRYSGFQFHRFKPKTRKGDEQKVQPSVFTGYQGEALVHILDKLLETGAERLVIDITHGINYMPSAIQEAGLEAATIYSVARSKDIVVEVWNSEPYPQSSPKNKSGAYELFLYRVKSVAMTPQAAAERVAYNYRQASLTVTTIHETNIFYQEEIDNRCKPCATVKPGNYGLSLEDISEKGAAAANIVLFNMPLAATYLSRQIAGEYGDEDLLERLLDYTREVIRIRKEHTHVDPEKKTVTPPYIIEPTKTTQALRAAALLSYIQHEATAGDGECVDVERLGEIKDRLGGLYEAIASKELHNIKCGRTEIPVYPSLKELKKKEKERCDPGSLDKRNLKAHAGMERNITAIISSHEEHTVCYKPGCWEELFKVIKKL